MMHKLAPLCDWTGSKNGEIIIGVVTTIAGLQLFWSSGSLFGINFPSVTIMGFNIGAQQVIGGIAVVSGVCVLLTCCVPMYGSDYDGDDDKEAFAAEYLGY